jgi:hypothetical protein
MSAGSYTHRLSRRGVTSVLLDQFAEHVYGAVRLPVVFWWTSTGPMPSRRYGMNLPLQPGRTAQPCGPAPCAHPPSSVLFGRPWPVSMLAHYTHSTDAWRCCSAPAPTTFCPQPPPKGAAAASTGCATRGSSAWRSAGRGVVMPGRADMAAHRVGMPLAASRCTHGASATRVTPLPPNASACDRPVHT